MIIRTTRRLGRRCLIKIRLTPPEGNRYFYQLRPLEFLIVNDPMRVNLWIVSYALLTRLHGMNRTTGDCLQPR